MRAILTQNLFHFILTGTLGLVAATLTQVNLGVPLARQPFDGFCILNVVHHLTHIAELLSILNSRRCLFAMKTLCNLTSHWFGVVRRLPTTTLLWLLFCSPLSGRAEEIHQFPLDEKLPRASIGVRMSHFWTQELIDYNGTLSPSNLLFLHREPLALLSYNHLVDSIDSETAISASNGGDDMLRILDGRKALSAGLVCWALANANRKIPTARKYWAEHGYKCLRVAVAGCDDSVLASMADLASAKCMIFLKPAEAGSLLIGVYERWRSTQKERAMHALFSLMLIDSDLKVSERIPSLAKKVREEFRGFESYRIYRWCSKL